MVRQTHQVIILQFQACPSPLLVVAQGQPLVWRAATVVQVAAALAADKWAQLQLDKVTQEGLV